ncbi:hypothetical protein D3C73_1670410 [compost metagenome]
MQNFIHVADKAQPPRTDGNPGQQIAQHRADTQTLSQRDGNHRSEQKQQDGRRNI